MKGSRLITPTWRTRSEALGRMDIMSLSTINQDDGPLDQPVQYQSDSQLNLYLMSMPAARHVSNIRRDPRVSAV